MSRLIRSGYLVAGLGVVLCATGCASSLAYQMSRNEIARARGVAANAASIGTWETLTHNVARQVAAAVIDAGAAWGVKEIGDHNGWWGDETRAVVPISPSPANIGRDNNNVSVIGDNNNVTISYPTESNGRD